jgi:hypothetical protein
MPQSGAAGEGRSPAVGRARRNSLVDDGPRVGRHSDPAGYWPLAILLPTSAWPMGRSSAKIRDLDGRFIARACTISLAGITAIGGLTEASNKYRGGRLFSVGIDCVRPFHAPNRGHSFFSASRNRKLGRLFPNPRRVGGSGAASRSSGMGSRASAIGGSAICASTRLPEAFGPAPGERSSARDRRWPAMVRSAGAGLCDQQ